MKNWKRLFILMITTGGFTYAGIHIWQSDYSAPIFAAAGAFFCELIIGKFKNN